MRLSLLTVPLLLVPSDRPAASQEPPPAGTPVDGGPLSTRSSDLPPGPDDAARRAIERGLAWMARDLTTSATGAAATGDPRHASPVGVTALSALAFLSAGNTPTRGPYQDELGRHLDYLLERVTPESEEAAGYVHATDDRQSRMHGHGLAVLAFTQAYTDDPRSTRGRRLSRAIELGVRRIEEAQGPDGGWYYEPEPWPLTEGSVTVCLLWALRGARNAGFQVDLGVIEGALEYVRSLQEEDGGFIYAPHQPESSVALTAACLSTLHAMGVYEGGVVDDGYAYVWRELTARGAGRPGSGPAAFPFYERWYLAQALWQHREQRVFRRWAAEEWGRILREQREDGSWADARYGPGGARIEGRYGSAYATAMSVLVLGVPEGKLPVFQR